MGPSVDPSESPSVSLCSNLLQEFGSSIKLTNLDLFKEENGIAITTIPGDIGCLTDLTMINFGYNDFTGSIPNEIGLLTGLTKLSLRYNDFTGTIPNEIGLLTDLTVLYLGNNNFTGTIPIEFDLLTNLIATDLSDL